MPMMPRKSGPAPPAARKPGTEMEMRDLFRTPVWTLDLPPDQAAALNGRLVKAIDALLEPRPALPPGANWQTDPVLQDHPDFADLMELVLKAGRRISTFLAVKPKDLAITGAWANVNPPGGRNSSHTHPNNFLSAVYYVEIPEGAAQITFEDPRPQAYVMMPPVERFGPYTANTVNVAVVPGRLVMFPAWLTHSVPVNPSTKDRVSIAINMMFRDYVEVASPALWKGTVPVAR